MEPLTELSQEGAGGGEPPGDGPLWTAVFEYEACGEDELSLRPGDVVQVLSRDSHVSGDEGWWTGKIDQRVGIFPSNYVSSGVPGGGPELRARYPPPPTIQRKGARARGGGLGGSQGRGPVPPRYRGLRVGMGEGTGPAELLGLWGEPRLGPPDVPAGRPGPALPWVLLEAGAAAEGEGEAHPGGERPWEAAGAAMAFGGERRGYGISAPPALGLPQAPVRSLSLPPRCSCCSSALLSPGLARRSLGGRASLSVLLAFQRRREQFPIVKTCVSRG